ncbi:MAG: Hsp20/alpha crystallin family protein [Candidatus Yanofskybacteria bacterium]|nr:Hsp20/alpha crystallin family protein [Candidatus Yanofskybacteria bacterium]
MTNDFFTEQFGTEANVAESGEAGLIASKNSIKTNRSEEGQLTVDVYQTENDIIIKSTIAGVTADDIDVSITNDMVTIKGNRSSEEKVKESDYYYQELYWGAFSRSIILPEEIDADKAKATMKNGILTLRLPKLAKNRVKRVRIAS